MIQFLQRRWLVPHPSLLKQLIVGGMTERVAKIVENCRHKWYSYRILKRYAGEQVGSYDFFRDYGVLSEA